MMSVNRHCWMVSRSCCVSSSHYFEVKGGWSNEDLWRGSSRPAAAVSSNLHGKRSKVGEDTREGDARTDFFLVVGHCF